MEQSLQRMMARILPHKSVQWAAVITLSLFFLALLEAFHLPAALLLGPMIGGILFSAAGGNVRVPTLLYRAAQALVAVMIASTLPLSHLGNVMRDWPILLFGVGSTVVVAATIGWILTRARIFPGTTAIWGCSPGAATTMVVMAEAYGADVRLVAFMQYLRVMCVAGFASLIASLAMGIGGHPMPAVIWLPPLDASAFALTLAVTLGSGLIAYVFKIPAGGFLVPMIAAILARETGLLTIVLPPWLLAISYALFGWSIGLRFTREVLAHATRALPQLLGAIAILIAICAGFGVILATVAGVDPLTAYLATSPGGADSVAIIAASSKVDMPFVMTMQMARFLVVTVTGPALARTLAGKFGQKPAKTDS